MRHTLGPFGTALSAPKWTHFGPIWNDTFGPEWGTLLVPFWLHFWSILVTVLVHFEANFEVQIELTFGSNGASFWPLQVTEIFHLGAWSPEYARYWGAEKNMGTNGALSVLRGSK